jgi:histidine ammonia-lyase
MAASLALGTRPLRGEDVIAVARDGRRVLLSPTAQRRMTRSRRTLERALSGGKALYGVNTGFGRLARTRIEGDDLVNLQLNLVRSHASGTGPELPGEVVRAMLLLRAASLAHGYSGVRPELARGFLALLNADIVPRVPGRGSVGASGDLAPLAHITLALLGEGRVLHRGRSVAARTALRRARIRPLKLTEKEGLASINGTQALTALGLITLWDACRLWEVSLAVGALSTEAIKGSDTPFHRRFGMVRTHPGHEAAARRLRGYFAGSEIRKSHIKCDRVQDPYSFRCQPQVMGAVKDALDYARSCLLHEINAVTDNPLVDDTSTAVLSGGNFHGQPVAMVLDHVTLALVTLGNISERRTAALMDPAISELPAFLAARPGRDSGLMLWQVSAAALASENKTAAMPASSDTVPTSANQEDFVSMGMGAAHKAAEALSRAEQIVAIELLAARFGIEHHAPLSTGRRLRPLMEQVGGRVRPMRADRNLQRDFAACLDLVRNGFSNLVSGESW